MTKKKIQEEHDKFTKEKFQQQSHGKIGNTLITPYEWPTGRESDCEDKVRDLRVITMNSRNLGITLKKNCTSESCNE